MDLVCYMQAGADRRQGGTSNPLKYFAELRDPRVERNREHLLEEILLIAIGRS
jgi:hypothetical protein